MEVITDKLSDLVQRVNLLEEKVQEIESILTKYFPLSLEKLLELRGLQIVKENRVIPIPNKDLLYRNLKSYHFRRTLHDVLLFGLVDVEKRQLLTKKWGKTVERYLSIIKTLGIVSEQNGILKSHFDISFMGNLLEWFVGRFLTDELHLETLINVHLKNLEDGGDIDVLSRIGAKLIIIETKESTPNNIPVSELKSIYKRIQVVEPDISILAIDTTLSIERNIINNLRWITEKEFQRVKEGVYLANKNFFVVSAKRNLLQNISFCITVNRNGIRKT